MAIKEDRHGFGILHATIAVPRSGMSLDLTFKSGGSAMSFRQLIAAILVALLILVPLMNSIGGWETIERILHALADY